MHCVYFLITAQITSGFCKRLQVGGRPGKNTMMLSIQCAIHSVDFTYFRMSFLLQYFSTWFNSLVVLDDKVSYELSLGIQPEKNPPPTNGHRKTDSFTSHSSSENIESSSALQRKVDTTL